MKEGVILAGGTGSRLPGASKFYNKHLALVYDRPMIEYPVETMKKSGVEFLHIVSTPQGVQDMFRFYRDEINGIPVRFHEQYQPLGSAHALGQTAIEGTFPVLCGDVYLDLPLGQIDIPTLYWTHYDNAKQHSVYDPESKMIIEKPIRDIGNRAVIAYVYDERVYDVIKTLKPTERGELELIDLHNWYLRNGADVREYPGLFQDMGTPDGLLRVALHEKARR